MTCIGALGKGKRKLFNVEPLAAPLLTSLNFGDTLGDYVLLVDPSLLPATDFLPSTNAFCLTDHTGQKRSIPNGIVPI